MPATEPTDRQLRASVYTIAKAYLEVERGLRPPEQLERYLTPAEYLRHRARPTSHATRTGEPVLPTDIGAIHLDRHLPGQITATLPTRETGQRWGALVLHFARRHTGRWRIDQLERLQRPSVARQPTRQPREDLDQRIRRIQDERWLVEAAYQTTRTRLADHRHGRTHGGPLDPATAKTLRQQQRTWKRRRTELDDELADLQRRRDLQAKLTDLDRPAPSGRDPTRLTDRQLTHLLGHVPTDPWRHQLRDALTDEIHTYRKRWNVTDPNTALGPQPDDPAHRTERTELADTLRASARALGTARPDDRGHDAGRQFTEPHERGLTPER
jgi:hypothetical protein